MRKLLFIMLCLYIHGMARGQTNTYEYRYWFDKKAVVNTGKSSTPSWHIDVSTKGLDNMIHQIHFQVKDTTGVWSVPVTRFFQKVSGTSAFKYRIWDADNTQNIITGPLGDGHIDVDVSSLSDGFHTLNVQIADATSTSTPITQMFIKIPQTENVDYMNCMFMVDGKPYRNEQVSSTDGIIKWTFDVDTLSLGLHSYLLQVVTPSGAASSTKEGFFFRANTKKELSTLKCCYMIDGDSTVVNAGLLTNGAYHFDLDVSKLTDGLHKIAYWLVADNGVSTIVQATYFMKIPVGGNGITEYQYWINNLDAKKHVTKLSTRKDPFSLVSLLPVETQAIRSSNYQFAFKNGSPLIYARNEFHIRFIDASGRFTETTKEYVDEKVSQAVKPVGKLKETQTFDRVAENAIRWYTVDLEEGDTVAFKSSQACSIQLFAPSGKEVYSASGVASVVLNGCHTWEDGTYYLAVHDVTGSQNKLTLEYMHMDKYDVVSQDIATVGNGGCSTITFKGNGFKDLYAVDFFNAANDTIHSFNIGHESDGTTTVTTDFTAATTGKYTALFHFADGKKYVYDAITVEEAKPIELATEVTFPRSFGHVVTYTCKITNNGNMTAYAVPIYTWLKSKTLNGIVHIDYEGLGLRGIYDEIDTDTLSADEIATLKSESAKLGHDHYFLKMWTEDEDNPGDSVFVRANYFFTNVAPNETKTLHLTLTMRETDAFAYFTVPKEWPTYGNVEETATKSRYKVRHASNNSNNWYCCYRERIECVANITTLIVDAATLVNPELGVADCALGWANQKLTAAGDTYCGKNDVEGDFAKRVNALTKTASAASTLLGCAGYGAASNVINAFLHPSVAINCITAFFKKIPNCPPIPPGGGGAQGGKSHDPNEIYGYLAESGSKFMTDEVEKVNYRIEFENDTAFATRSAMVVEICDTLDSKLFDLNSYAPTGIKIGEKSEYLDGEQNFVRTIDMRPEINGLVEVEGKYDAKKGIMTWLFTSIDPMTMEPTNDPMDGFLPVNTNGQGIGEVSYDINLKQKFANGTKISNRASIVFDINEAIMTPTWTNIIDAVAPQSDITKVFVQNDTTITLHLEGTDNLSGVWCYNVYVQAGEDAPWWLAGEHVTDSVFKYVGAPGVNYGFCVVATDSAGNVEQKALARDVTVTTIMMGDANDDGIVNALDAVLAIKYYLDENNTYLNFEAADVVKDDIIDAKDVVAIQQIYLETAKNKKLQRKRLRKKDD